MRVAKTLKNIEFQRLAMKTIKFKVRATNTMKTPNKTTHGRNFEYGNETNENKEMNSIGNDTN